MPSNPNANVKLSADVEAAVRDGQPIVALESTIVCHGMPFPQNIETAFEMQAVIREAGAVPAMVAVDRGVLAAGLTDADIERFGRDGANIVKASRRDLPFLMAEAADGATTVAATMWIAAQAGISVFATGGIGGVHRGVETTMDVSADLEELAQTNVAVVCAGVKSVLDIPRTLEYLETRGVPVIGYGTDTLPAFYTTTSGLAVDRRIDNPAEVARVMSNKWEAGLQGGLVVAVPVPREDALDAHGTWTASSRKRWRKWMQPASPESTPRRFSWVELPSARRVRVFARTSRWPSTTRASPLGSPRRTPQGQRARSLAKRPLHLTLLATLGGPMALR